MPAVAQRKGDSCGLIRRRLTRLSCPPPFVERLQCDTDVALMVARFAGAGLGLLAFTIAVLGGLYAHNPITVTLSRSILALLLFCVLGLVLGTAVQMVITDYERGKEEEIRSRYRSEATDDGVGPSQSPEESSSDETQGVTET